MSNKTYFTVLIIILTTLINCQLTEEQPSFVNTEKYANAQSGLNIDWCVKRNKYADGQCDHCPLWDSDCPSPDAWGRSNLDAGSESTKGKPDWCVKRSKYADGQCDHCPLWDPDCPSPDAWGRSNPNSETLEGAGTPEDAGIIIHDRNNHIAGLILPLQIQEVPIPMPINDSPHIVTFIGDSNTDNPYLDPSYGQTTIPPIESDKRVSSLFAKEKLLSYAPKHKIQANGVPVQVVNWGVGGANTKFFIEFYPSHISQYVVISLGLNEKRHYPVGTAMQPILNTFREDTLLLLAKVKSQNSIPVLMTNVHQDALNGHQSSIFGDNVITMFDNIYREISAEEQIPLIDINLKMRSLANQGIWDFRRRVYNSTPVLDARYDLQRSSDHRWHGDVHWNPYGAKVAAEEIARRFSDL